MSDFWNGTAIGLVAGFLIFTPSGRGITGAAGRITGRAITYGAERAEKAAERRFSIIK